MPRFFVTRGLGGSVTDLLASGLFKDDIRAAFKGGKRFAKKAIKDFEENFKISVMLLGINGKELTKPIISTVTKIFKNNNDIKLEVIPTKLIARKSTEISVAAKLSGGKENEPD